MPASTCWQCWAATVVPRPASGLREHRGERIRRVPRRHDRGRRLPRARRRSRPAGGGRPGTGRSVGRTAPAPARARARGAASRGRRPRARSRAPATGDQRVVPGGGGSRVSMVTGCDGVGAEAREGRASGRAGDWRALDRTPWAPSRRRRARRPWPGRRPCRGGVTRAEGQAVDREAAVVERRRVGPSAPNAGSATAPPSAERGPSPSSITSSSAEATALRSPSAPNTTDTASRGSAASTSDQPMASRASSASGSDAEGVSHALVEQLELVGLH